MPSPTRARQALSRREILKLGLAGTACGAFGWPLVGCGRHDYGDTARHVVLISLDTTRRDHIGCYQRSAVATPHIDRFAAEGLRCNNHLTPATTTLASHASMFTGKYPQNHGVPRNGFVLHRENPLLAEILGAAGFRTAGFLGSFALDSRFGIARGFEHYDQEFDIFFGEDGADQNQRRATAVTDAVDAYLDRARGADRRFLFVHYFDPHQPYDPPAEYAARYVSPSGTPAMAVGNHPVLPFGEHTAVQRQMILNYAGEISYMDAEVGRLFEVLQRRDILDEALVILTSDHGEHLGVAPAGEAMDHGWTVYEPEARAIFCLRLPGARLAGTLTRTPTSHIDILPTVCRFLGLTAPEEIDGRALDPDRLAPDDDDRLLFAEATKPWEEVETDPRWTNARKPRCVCQGSYKYIRTAHLDHEELYDLDADRLEQTNLLKAGTAQHRAIAERLRNELEAFTNAAHPLPTRFDDSQSEETRERLRSLGYL